MFGIGAWRERAAARWLARMGNESAAFDRAAFERWRGRSRGNARAFDDLAASWRLDLPIANAQGFRPSSEAVGLVPHSRWPARGAIAALIVASVAATTAYQQGWLTRQGTPSAATIDLAADQARTVRLADGSTIRLDRGARLQVAYSANARMLTLLKGNARFDVAHDASRPFTVHAGHGIVTARGTLFDVSIIPAGMSVALLRGKVDVARDDVGPNPRSQPLRPGEQVRVPVVGPIGPVEPAKSAALARDMIEFDHTPLADAIATYNLHNARQIRLAAGGLRGGSLTGAFRASDPEAFAQAIATMFQLTIMRAAGGAIELTTGQTASAK